jgi:putative transposase
VRLVQELEALKDCPEYVQHQERVAQELGRSIRSVRRWQQRYREQGIDGLIEHRRRDAGVRKIGETWEKFIVQTYREGNRGGRKLSPRQVSVRVQARAMELEETCYPGQMTVYRILRPEIEKGKSPKRSLGWRGDTLVIITRAGKEIPIESSNQVWQCDHTRVDVLLVSQSGE